MLEVTYYYVEKIVQPEQGWRRVQPMSSVEYFGKGGLRDRAQAEKLLEEEKAHWDQCLAEYKQEAGDDEAYLAHIEHLEAVRDWRIVEETETFTHASLYMYSDVKAYEIVKVISEQTLEVRPMITTHSAAGLEFTPGGFFGHVHDQHKQKVTYESNPEAGTIRIRKKKGSAELWTHKGNRFYLQTEPYAFHDYNF